MTKIDPGAIMGIQSPVLDDPVTGAINMNPVRIVRAENDILFAEDGQAYIDLFSAHGTAWLGHANPAVAARVAEQLERLWVTGGLETPASSDAKALVEQWFPGTHRVAGLYSTGMEAAEFALRVARVVTQRNGAVGFERSMHGKSLATSCLGWENHDGVRIADFHRLPFVPHGPEDKILAELDDTLSTGRISAVFVEPLQGIGGAHMASGTFYREAARLCAAHGALLVFDEILTGFHRSGPPFFFSGLGVVPDIVLIGKGLGNGFPVSAVVLGGQYQVEKKMLPGSTYSGNPLASAAVVGTLQQMRALDLPTLVRGIEATITRCLRPLEDLGAALRGRGAMWVLELPPGWSVERVATRIHERGVLVSYDAQYLRILPAATITQANLERACAVIGDGVARGG